MPEKHKLKNNGVEALKDYSESDSSKLLTIKQFCNAYPWPSESAMRAYCYRARDLDLCDAFVRVGRRVLVVPSIFFSKIRQIEVVQRGEG